MKTYRIYTENKRKRFLLRLFSESFPGFTVYKATGFWQGKQEKTLVFEIITNDLSADCKLSKMCKQICGYNSQNEILISVSDCVVMFVGTSGILGE